MSEYKGAKKGGEEKALQEAIILAEKNFKKWLLISIIPIVNFVTMGFAIFCYNNLCYLKSNGKSRGNGFLRFLMMLYALYIPPVIVVRICCSNEKLQKKILGWENL